MSFLLSLYRCLAKLRTIRVLDPNIGMYEKWNKWVTFSFLKTEVSKSRETGALIVARAETMQALRVAREPEPLQERDLALRGLRNGDVEEEEMEKQVATFVAIMKALRASGNREGGREGCRCFYVLVFSVSVSLYSALFYLT